MTVQWIEIKLDGGGTKYVSSETIMTIEVDRDLRVSLWMEPGKPILEPKPFLSVREAKAYVNKMLKEQVKT